MDQWLNYFHCAFRQLLVTRVTSLPKQNFTVIRQQHENTCKSECRAHILTTDSTNWISLSASDVSFIQIKCLSSRMIFDGFLNKEYTCFYTYLYTNIAYIYNIMPSKAKILEHAILGSLLQVYCKHIIAYVFLPINE